MIIKQVTPLATTIEIENYQLKALRTALALNREPLFYAAQKMREDGHDFTAEDVEAVVNQFLLATRKLCSLMSENAKEDDTTPPPTEEKVFHA